MPSSRSTTFTSGSSITGAVEIGKRWWLAIAATAANCSLYNEEENVDNRINKSTYFSGTLLNMSEKIFFIGIYGN